MTLVWFRFSVAVTSRLSVITRAMTRSQKWTESFQDPEYMSDQTRWGSYKGVAGQVATAKCLPWNVIRFIPSLFHESLKQHFLRYGRYNDAQFVDKVNVDAIDSLVWFYPKQTHFCCQLSFERLLMTPGPGTSTMNL